VFFGLISMILLVMKEQKLIQSRQENKTQSNRYYHVENKERESKILQKLMENHNQEINMRKVTTDFGTNLEIV